ncbi:hypothetical protein [Streptomyces showdoensis]|nr:hypothetical protein [Streptomyces showdoensis]
MTPAPPPFPVLARRAQRVRTGRATVTPVSRSVGDLKNSVAVIDR